MGLWPRRPCFPTLLPHATECLLIALPAFHSLPLSSLFSGQLKLQVVPAWPQQEHSTKNSCKIKQTHMTPQRLFPFFTFSHIPVRTSLSSSCLSSDVASCWPTLLSTLPFLVENRCSWKRRAQNLCVPTLGLLLSCHPGPCPHTCPPCPGFSHPSPPLTLGSLPPAVPKTLAPPPPLPQPALCSTPHPHPPSCLTGKRRHSQTCVRSM